MIQWTNAFSFSIAHKYSQQNFTQNKWFNWFKYLSAFSLKPNLFCQVVSSCQFSPCGDVFHLTVRRRLPGPGGPGHTDGWLSRHCTFYNFEFPHTLLFFGLCKSTWQPTYTAIWWMNFKYISFSWCDWGNFMRSCHNFTHQNCVAIYCAGFPNWLVKV